MKIQCNNFVLLFHEICSDMETMTEKCLVCGAVMPIECIVQHNEEEHM
jgi:hypothetical protein